MKIRSVPKKSTSKSAVKLWGFVRLHQNLRFHSFAFSKIAVSMKKIIRKSWQKSRNCETISLLNRGFARLKWLRKVSFETISLIWDYKSHLRRWKSEMVFLMSSHLTVKLNMQRLLSHFPFLFRYKTLHLNLFSQLLLPPVQTTGLPPKFAMYSI